MDEDSKCTLWVVYPGPYSSQPVSGVFEKGACTDDMIMCLEGGRVVGGVMAWAEEERQGFVLVFPHGLFEVFTCGCVISAHLGELGEVFVVDVFEPFGWSKTDKGRGFVHVGEGEESTLTVEDLLVVVLKVIKEVVPFLESHGFDLCECS